MLSTRVAGASAMILPGVSGGYLLLVMGVYVTILSGVDQVKEALKAKDFDALMTPFMDVVPAVSLRENRRLYETGNGANPHWHQTTDLFETFSDADFTLGLNAAQTTLGAIAKLAGIRITRE